MAKGKKKGDKKKDEPKQEDQPTTDEPSVSALSITEDQPSTSKETSPPVAVEEDDGGLGLGLGGARKKRPKKKKETPTAVAPAADTVLLVPSVADVVPQPVWGVKKVQQPVEQPQARPFVQSAPGFQTGPVPPPGYPITSRPPQPAYPGGPVEAQHGDSDISTHIAQSQPPSGFIPQSGPPMGRGRGRGVRGPQDVQYARPGDQPYAGSSTPTTQFPHSNPQQSAPQAPAGGGDRRQSPTETTLCRFKIPAKIIGNKVPSRPVRVLANYLAMTIKPLKIHRYDVSFKPDKPKKMLPRAFHLAKEKLFRNSLIAFDQMKNAYALNALPKVTQTERLVANVEFQDNNGRTMTFEVSFKGTGIVDLGTILNYMKSGGTSLNPPTEAIQCVDVILRQGTLESYIKAGRQFFKRPARPIDLGDGLEIWTGLFQSAIFTSSPFINIDVAHKGFPKQQPLLDAFVKDFKLDPTKPLSRQRGRGVEGFPAFLKGLRVVASIGGDVSTKGQKREFICNELVESPNKISFDMTDASGKKHKMTVADYFAKEKRIRLKYPDLNCVWVGPREKKIYYPMELLEVAYGQARMKQLNDMQLSTMVREAATPPDERKRKIEEVIRDMNYSSNPFFKQFGMDIKNEFLQVQAKVLVPPKLDIGGGKLVQPARGAWQANRLLKPEALESWAFIGLETDPHSSNGEQIISLLTSVGSQMGMKVNRPKEILFDVRISNLKQVLFTMVEKDINFLVIVMATRGRDFYHQVKQMAERDVGIITQCIKEYTASRRMNAQTARNILLKVNSKLMGINQALDMRNLPACLAGGGVMVVGADVTHPSPDQSSIPSIAAVTASIDPRCFIYNIELSVQTPKKEMIVEFEDMMVEHLQVYRQHQKELPKKIFVFRDGVSEGQFAQVMNSELQAVYNAYSRLTRPDKPQRPEVLFLLVQKRHHTRFFLGSDKPQNVEPGTVVDTQIVHASELDFYLVSHQAIKGTSRPTRYHAVFNEGKIPHDEVEQLTYFLCHIYARCMRSVSYPTPTYYAHLACLRARSLTFGQRFDIQELEKKPVRLRVLKKILDSSRMFYV